MITGKIQIKKGQKIKYAAIVDEMYNELYGLLIKEDVTEAGIASNNSDIITASVKYEIVFKRIK